MEDNPEYLQGKVKALEMLLYALMRGMDATAFNEVNAIEKRLAVVNGVRIGVQRELGWVDKETPFGKGLMDTLSDFTSNPFL